MNPDLQHLIFPPFVQVRIVGDWKIRALMQSKAGISCSSPGRPGRCACSRIKLGGDSADCFFVRKGRKERKESKGDFRVKRSRSATFPSLLFFASFASFADKFSYSITYVMFGESPGRPCRRAYSRKEYPLKIKDMRDVL
jgi:hypothetical protein